MPAIIAPNGAISGVKSVRDDTFMAGNRIPCGRLSSFPKGPFHSPRHHVVSHTFTPKIAPFGAIMAAHSWQATASRVDAAPRANS